MSRVVVVSPHLDDGVFSTGDMLAGESNALVLTVFAGVPEKTLQTDYDKSTGFSNSKSAMLSRREEDTQATAALGVEYKHLPFLDGQYNVETDKYEILMEVSKVLDEADVIYMPVGMKHPDHEHTRDFVLAYRLLHQEKLYFLYEELPYRVIEPNLAKEILEEVPIFDTYHLELMNPRKVTNKKILAVSRYRSQMDTGDISPYTVLVPERHWKVTKNEQN